MKDRDILNNYIPLVEFLGSVMGDSTEVVLQDLSQPEHSVIAIHNGHLSGRTIGSPLTDFAVNAYHSDEYSALSYRVNYHGKAKDKKFISSTYFIKNFEGKMIGMLCVNKDTSAVRNLQDSLDDFLRSINLQGGLREIPASNCPDVIQENLDAPIDSIAETIVSKTLNAYSVTPDRMTRDEKKHIVWELDDQGISRIKGGVSEIARVLGLSESTVYRYISQREPSQD